MIQERSRTGFPRPLVLMAKQTAQARKSFVAAKPGRLNSLVAELGESLGGGLPPAFYGYSPRDVFGYGTHRRPSCQLQ